MMDLPAPVSPEMTVIPGLNSRSRLSAMAKLEIAMLVNMVQLRIVLSGYLYSTFFRIGKS
jgi:hypothetical protein